MHKYIINEIPPSNNKFIGRTNFREYQRIKKYWAELLFYMCNPKPKKTIEKATIELKYFFKDKQRRDPDNYSGKMVLDGLVKAGIIKDDSFNCIELKLCGLYDKENPRLEITIEEKKQDV